MRSEIQNITNVAENNLNPFMPTVVPLGINSLLCRETQSLGQQMLNAPFGINGLRRAEGTGDSSNPLTIGKEGTAKV